MISKRRRNHLKAAREASVASFKKRKCETSLTLSSAPVETLDALLDSKLDTTDTSDTEDESGTWYWNESAHESDSDSEEEGNDDVDFEGGKAIEHDLEAEQPRVKRVVNTEVPMMELKWSREGEDKRRGGYGNGSRSTRKRHKKAAEEKRKEAAKSYNIKALWERNENNTLISTVPRGGTPSFSKREVLMNQRTEALSDLTKLLESVRAQEKKYGYRLAPHTNFRRRHVMVQQFLQSQLVAGCSSRRDILLCNVAQSFGRSSFTGRNIRQWENLWMSSRDIPARQERNDYDSWMYDGDLNDAMRKFARTQGDKLSSYKLVQFLKEYVNPKGTETPIVIRSRTARNWLRKLGFEYKDVRKDVFVDGHERSDVIKDRVNFLKKMEELKPYMVEFEESGAMKPKVYPIDCVVGGEDRRPVIVITHDECTFSANDGIRKAWTMKGDTYLRPKGRGQGIMTSDFLLPFGRLNLASLDEKKREEVVEKARLVDTDAVEIFEYGKNNDGYWDGAKLHKQVVNKALPIAEALYPGYSLLFLFDNATSHSVYAKDALQAKEMNKSTGGRQAQLREGWFDRSGSRIAQPMNFQEPNGQRTQKGIQRVLEERDLWPTGGLNLECSKPKCFNCQVAADCKVCTKGHKCDLCKAPRIHSASDCSKNRKCDACADREKNCCCVSKKYCSTCAIKKGKCGDCEDLPPKCATDTCCARRLLSVQPDFQAQKCEIEESITSSENGKYHIVMYYPKYHCELNHIEHFWCSAKKWARENCNYTLDDLRRRVPRALSSVPNRTILAYFYRCRRKMDLYSEGIGYGSTQWKTRTAHHKPTNKDEDR